MSDVVLLIPLVPAVPDAALAVVPLGGGPGGGGGVAPAVVLLEPDVPLEAVSSSMASSNAARMDEAVDVLALVAVPDAVVPVKADSRLDVVESVLVLLEALVAGGGPGGGPDGADPVPLVALVLPSLPVPVLDDADNWARKAIMAEAPVLSSVAVVALPVVAVVLLLVVLLVSRMLLMSCAAKLLLDPDTESDTAVPRFALPMSGNFTHSS